MLNERNDTTNNCEMGAQRVLSDAPWLLDLNDDMFIDISDVCARLARRAGRPRRDAARRQWTRLARLRKKQTMVDAFNEFQASPAIERGITLDGGRGSLDVNVPDDVIFRGRTLDEEEREILVQALRSGALDEILRRQVAEGAAALHRCFRDPAPA
jgi:hypothetical protein